MMDKQQVAITYLERDIARLDKDVAVVQDSVSDLRVQVATIGAKLAIYSGIGAVLGGSICSALLHFLSK